MFHVALLVLKDNGDDDDHDDDDCSCDGKTIVHRVIVFLHAHKFNASLNS